MKGTMLVHAAKRIMVQAVRECWSLYSMRRYWNRCARENARRHIATDDWKSEEHFHRSGLRDSRKMLGEHAAHLDEGARILEIGCGIGRLLKPLALMRSDWVLYGVDVSTEMVAQGRERLRDFPNVHLSPVNGKDLSCFKDEFFDLVFSYITFQHIPRAYLPGIFREVYRVLKKDGVFTFQLQCLKDNHGEDPPDSDFRRIRYYTPALLRSLCSESNFNALSMQEPVGRGGYLYATAVK